MVGMAAPVPSLWVKGVASGKLLVLWQKPAESFFAVWFQGLQPLQVSESRRNTVHLCSASAALQGTGKSADFPKTTHTGWNPLFALDSMDFFNSCSGKEHEVQKLAPGLLASGLQDSLGIMTEIVLYLCSLWRPHQNPGLQILFLFLFLTSLLEYNCFTMVC